MGHAAAPLTTAQARVYLQACVREVVVPGTQHSAPAIRSALQPSCRPSTLDELCNATVGDSTIESMDRMNKRFGALFRGWTASLWTVWDQASGPRYSRSEHPLRVNTLT